MNHAGSSPAGECTTVVLERQAAGGGCQLARATAWQAGPLAVHDREPVGERGRREEGGDDPGPADGGHVRRGQHAVRPVKHTGKTPERRRKTPERSAAVTRRLTRRTPVGKPTGLPSEGARLPSEAPR